MTLRDVWKKLRAQLGKAPIVTRLGLFGVFLGIACVASGLILGFRIPPEGNLWETATFDAALGIFILTQAALVPEAGFNERGQRRWAWTLVALALYAYGIETVQAFRGLDPRISEVGAPTDQILGGVFFLSAVAIMVVFLVLAWRFFRSESTPLRIAVRYGAIASMVGFFVGIWMSIVTAGRFVPEEGNLLFIHAAGFHGLQAVPLVALLLVWGGAEDATARRWVHAAGLAWVTACAAILWQSMAGRPTATLSVPTTAAGLLLASWAIIAVMALRVWRIRPVGDPNSRR